MTEKNIEKTFEITNIVKTYIADDGKEFTDMDKCITYENELFFNRYADKYKIKSISVPTFICDDDYVRGISFYFPQNGDEDEVMRLLSIYQTYEISISNNKWTRDLIYVRDSDFKIKIPFELNKGDYYIFYFCWREYNDENDYFHNQIVSKEIAITELEKEIKEFEEVFETKFESKRKMTKEELIKLSRENLRNSKQGSLCECYDEAFMKGYELSAKRVTELEKENTELKAFRQDCIKLTEDNVVMARQRKETAGQLTKAKEIIKDLLQCLPKENIEGVYEITEEAEEFIKLKL